MRILNQNEPNRVRGGGEIFPCCSPMAEQTPTSIGQQVPARSTVLPHGREQEHPLELPGIPPIVCADHSPKPPLLCRTAALAEG